MIRLSLDLSPKDHRRFEARLYLVVTSTSPLRLYRWHDAWVAFSQQRYNESEFQTNPCMLNTHAHTTGCKTEGLLKINERAGLSMDKTAHFLQLSNETRQRFERTTNELLTHVIREAGPEINSHIVNKGIKASGASCFSYMRADMAMSSDGSAIPRLK